MGCTTGTTTNQTTTNQAITIMVAREPHRRNATTVEDIGMWPGTVINQDKIDTIKVS